MKGKIGQVTMIATVAVFLFLCAGYASAQDRPATTGQLVIEKIKADKKLLVAENMQLTEAEAKAFWPVYDQYQAELFLLRTRTLKLLKDYAASYETMTNATAKRLLDEYMTIETLQLKLRQSYLPKFRKALSDAKTVRYYQIENKIQAVLVNDLAETIPLIKTDTK